MGGLTSARLRDVLSYDPNTGVFCWLPRPEKASSDKSWNTRFAGKKAGAIVGRYIEIRIDGRRYLAHRLAWFYMTGEWPVEIDHRDCNGFNNKWRNIRCASRGQNEANKRLSTRNTTGAKGVYRRADCNRFLAQVWVGGRTISLGLFSTFEDAVAARQAAAKRLHGEFARTA